MAKVLGIFKYKGEEIKLRKSSAIKGHYVITVACDADDSIALIRYETLENAERSFRSLIADSLVKIRS